MDNLIVMPRPATPTLNRMPEGGSAVILFFTGVRYLRNVDDAALVPAAPKATVASRRRRSNKGSADPMNADQVDARKVNAGKVKKANASRVERLG